MEYYIADLNNLSDSKEMMLSKPNPWMTRFLYFLAVILIAALCWAYFGEIDEYVKANGVVRPMEKISTVVNQVTGEVKTVLFHEGMQVNEGDLLYTISHDELSLEADVYEKQIKKTELEIKHLKLMEKSVLEMKNFFDIYDDIQKDWFYQYLKFEIDYNMEKENATQEQQKSDVDQKNLQGYKLLKESILTEKSLFRDKNDPFALRYADYKTNHETMTQALKNAKENLVIAKELFTSQAISQKDLDDAKYLVEDAERKLENYKANFLLSVSESIEQLESAMTSEYSQLRLAKIKNDKLVAINQSLATEEQNLEQLNKELINIQLRIKDHTCYAKTNGRVHILSEFREGDTLQSGLEIATIIPNNSDELKVQLAISNQDISDVNNGDTVKFHFHALPYKEFGELFGTILTISEDARVNQENGDSFYYAEAALDNKDLFGYKGQEGSILVGMTCEAQILNKSKKILYWFLEKIDLME